MAKAKEELGHLYTQPEDVISTLCSHSRLRKYWKLAKQTKVDYDLLEKAEKDHPAGYLPV